MMQMKQQQELQRYLQQVQQNIDTVSVTELLHALMAQPTTYQLGQSADSGGMVAQPTPCQLGQSADSGGMVAQPTPCQLGQSADSGGMVAQPTLCQLVQSAGSGSVVAQPTLCQLVQSADSGSVVAQPTLCQLVQSADSGSVVAQPTLCQLVQSAGSGSVVAQLTPYQLGQSAYSSGVVAQPTWYQLSQQSLSSVGGSGVVSTTVWSSMVPATAAAGVIYSTAGVHQSPLPATYMPPQSADGQSADVVSGSSETLMSADAESLYTDSAVSAMMLSPPAVDAHTSADIWADIVSVNTDSLDLLTTTDMAYTAELTETAASGRCSPGMSQADGTDSLRDVVCRVTELSDGEVSNNEDLAEVTLQRKQSAEELAADTVDKLSAQLPEVSSLGFVPIQNQAISSRSDSMDSMASSVAGCALQLSVECPDVAHQTAMTTTVREPIDTSAAPAAADLLDTVHSLLGQLTAGGNRDASAVHTVTPSSEPAAEQLQQSQTMIQQQQQQQLAAIASAIENLQHLRSLQEVIGNLAAALKTSQLEMLSAALQAGEVSTGHIAGTAIPEVRPPAVAMSSALPQPALITPEPAAASRGLPAPQLAPLSLLQYPATSNATLLMQQQQQQQLLRLAMMQSAPYQQQQLWMQQLVGRSAAAMMPPDTAGHVAQQPWQPVMMMPHRRPMTPVCLPAVTPGLPVQHAAARLGVPAAVMTPTSLAPPSAVQAAASQTPVSLRPSLTNPLSTAAVPSLQTSLPNQR